MSVRERERERKRQTDRQTDLQDESHTLSTIMADVPHTVLEVFRCNSPLTWPEVHGGRPAGTSGCQCGFSGCSLWYLWNNSTSVWQDEHAGGWGISHAYIYSNKCNNDSNDHQTDGLILKIKPFGGGESPNYHRVEAVKPAVSQHGQPPPCYF